MQSGILESVDQGHLPFAIQSTRFSCASLLKYEGIEVGYTGSEAWPYRSVVGDSMNLTCQNKCLRIFTKAHAISFSMPVLESCWPVSYVGTLLLTHSASIDGAHNRIKQPHVTSVDTCRFVPPLGHCVHHSYAFPILKRYFWHAMGRKSCNASLRTLKWVREPWSI